MSDGLTHAAAEQEAYTALEAAAIALVFAPPFQIRRKHRRTLRRALVGLNEARLLSLRKPSTP